MVREHFSSRSIGQGALIYIYILVKERMKGRKKSFDCQYNFRIFTEFVFPGESDFVTVTK